MHSLSMPPEGAKIPAPRGATFDSDGTLYVLDDAGRVLVFDPQGELIRQWFMPEYSVGKPEGVWRFLDGRIAVADTHYHRVVFFDEEGNVLSMHGEKGAEQGQFGYPIAITQDPDGNYYVAEYGGNDRVQKFDVDGNWLTEFGSFGIHDGEFQRPSGIAWQDGFLYVVDAINNRVQVFRDSGEFVRIAGAPDGRPAVQYPYDLAQDAGGDLWVIEYGGNRVTKMTTDGQTLGVFGSSGGGRGQFSTPWGIAVAADGRVIVCDTGNRRLVELKP
ncbi:MAG: NHL repeat-containing protein [Planctomycetota bacterium]